eukprot:TRINITY_DN48375_c0_g1_i1.p1 TRINITY_DN48375_c0_g1~~TRINITY_DN48375_c0_g1_i1.p1  ORF type:complete len:911 (-),score=183.18 TRINITY_DN48375_c0_g1_i1:182-2914(-)
MPSAKSPLTCLKFEMDGFISAKTAIFVPETAPMDQSVITEAVTRLHLPTPNLTIMFLAPHRHPEEFLSAKELTSARLAPIRKTGKKDQQFLSPEETKRVLLHKLDAIIHAIMCAADQTGSWLVSDHTPNGAELMENEILRKGSADCTQVNFFNACPKGQDGLSANVCLEKECWRMLKDMFKAAVPLHKFKTCKPLKLKSDLLKKVRKFGMSTKFPGHFFLQGEADSNNLALEKRAPCSQWIHAEADFFFIKVPVGGIVEPKESEHDSIADNSCEMPIDDLFGNMGKVYISGRSYDTVSSIMETFKNGFPTIFINNTGGTCNSASQIILAVQRLMKGDIAFYKKVVLPIHSAAAMPVLLERRLANVSASLILGHANRQASRAANEEGMFEVAHMAALLDMVKARPKYFSESVAVIDPVKDSPEEALERLSACFSSTYVGALELGASSALTDCVLEAWKNHKDMMASASSLRRCASILTYTGATFTWLSIVVSLTVSDLEHCPLEGDSGPHSNLCRLEEYLKSHRVIDMADGMFWLRAFLVFIPIFSGLVATVGSYFLFLEKWAAVHLQAAELVREIYRFRANLGQYALTAADGETSACVKKRVRKQFAQKVSALYSSVLNTTLKNGAMNFSSAQMTSEEVSSHVVGSLYGLWKPKTQQPAAASTNATPELARIASEIELGSMNDARRPLAGGAPGESHGSDSDDDVAPSAPVDERYAWMDVDDFVSPITAEVYFTTRLMPLAQMYTESIPALSRRHHMNNLLLFAVSFLASVMAAFQLSGWIPAAVGLGSMLMTIFHFQNVRAELSSKNQARASLRELELGWASYSNVDRRTPIVKEQLVQTVEAQVISVTHAMVGGAGVQSSGDDNAKDGGDKNDKKKKKKDDSSDDDEEKQDRMEEGGGGVGTDAAEGE